MRFLLWLNRLSEDLDFIGQGFQDFESLGKDIQEHFFKQKNIALEYKLQKFRITLKFRNFLDNFWLKFENSKDLYLKIEVSDHFDFCKKHITKDYPVLYQNKSMIVHSLDSSTLFSTKLNAVLHRQWTKKTATSQISIKWRDFYDLFRYLQKGIVPNIDCIASIDSMAMLKSKIIDIVKHTDFWEVVQDIKPFLEDDTLSSFIQENGKTYIIEKVEQR